jgi:hypothetical protein
MSKYFGLDAGVKKLISFLNVSTGVADAGKPIETNAQGKIDESLLPSGVGPDIKVLEASENVNAGEPVNIWDDGGTWKVRKADTTSASKLAVGFVLESFTTGQQAKIYPEGINNQASGLVPGPVYLAESAGGLIQGSVAIDALSSGSHIQCLGYALSATEMSIEIEADPFQV